MDNKDIQLIFKIPYKFDIYMEDNFNELLWVIDQCLLNSKKSRTMNISYNGIYSECNIGDIAYGMSQNGSIKESIVSAIICMSMDPTLSDNDDVNTFKNTMSIIEWHR